MNLKKESLVQNKNQIVIKDACIFIDLIELDLLDHFYELGYIICTTPFVLDEIVQPNQVERIGMFVENGKVFVDDSGSLEDIQKVFQSDSGLSFTDASVLELAQRTGGWLLSSDGCVRKIGKKSGIEVYGILWVIERLTDKGLLDPLEAIARLERYMEINSRAAPRAMVTALITRLKDA